MRRLAIIAFAWLAMAAAPAVPDIVSHQQPAIQARIDAELDAGRAAVMTDAQAGLDHADAADRLARGLPAGSARELDGAKADMIRTWAMLGLGRTADALQAADQGAAVAHRLAHDTKLEGDLLRARGIAAGAIGHVQASLGDLQQAFRVFQRAGEARGQATTLQDIGTIYTDAGDYPRVLAYFSQSAELNVHDPLIAMAAENNIAFALMRMHQPERAIRHYRRALATARTLQSPLYAIRVLTNLASAQVTAGDLGEAQASIQRARALAAADASASGWEPFVWGVAAQAAARAGDYRDAARDLETAFKGVDLSKTDQSWRDFHQTAVQVYRKLGDDRRALAHLTAYERLDDASRALAASTNSALMSARFDYSNQNLKIARLKAGELQRDIALGRARGRMHRIIFLTVIAAGTVILSLLLFALASTRRSRNEISAINLELTHANGALEKALRAKTEFLATTSHEIRTPLNGILGMTQVILADQALETRLRDRVEVVQSAGHTMRALVDDILDVAKMQNGQLTIVPAEMSLDEVLREAERLWSGEAEREGLALSITNAGAPSRIVADDQRLRQIVFNLLSNALKFTQAGAVTLVVDTEAHELGEQLVVRVSDTGIGIAPEHRDEIFESFHQIDGGTTRRFGGTGLGLAISRNLAIAMGGMLALESSGPGGSTFRFTLPLVLPAAEPAQRADAAATRLDEARIVLLERNPLTQSLMRALLAQTGAQLEAVATAPEALAKLAAAPADLLLVDRSSLPEDETLACQALGALRQQAAARIVVLAANLGDDGRAWMLAAGATLVLAKPIAGPVLVERLRVLFEGAADASMPAIALPVTAAA